MAVAAVLGGDVFDQICVVLVYVYTIWHHSHQEVDSQSFASFNSRFKLLQWWMLPEGQIKIDHWSCLIKRRWRL